MANHKKKIQILQSLLLALAIFLGAGTLAMAESTASSEFQCADEISKAEALIASQGADSLSAQAAQKAAKICQTEFNLREIHYFQRLATTCDESFAGASQQGVTSQTMHSVCHMNAARFVMSLQLPSSRIHQVLKLNSVPKISN